MKYNGDVNILGQLTINDLSNGLQEVIEVDKINVMSKPVNKTELSTVYNPYDGLIVYVKDENKFYAYNESLVTWEPMNVGFNDIDKFSGLLDGSLGTDQYMLRYDAGMQTFELIKFNLNSLSDVDIDVNTLTDNQSMVFYKDPMTFQLKSVKAFNHEKVIDTEYSGYSVKFVNKLISRIEELETQIFNFKYEINNFIDEKGNVFDLSLPNNKIYEKHYIFEFDYHILKEGTLYEGYDIGYDTNEIELLLNGAIMTGVNIDIVVDNNSDNDGVGTQYTNKFHLTIEISSTTGDNYLFENVIGNDNKFKIKLNPLSFYRDRSDGTPIPVSNTVAEIILNINKSEINLDDKTTSGQLDLINGNIIKIGYDINDDGYDDGVNIAVDLDINSIDFIQLDNLAGCTLDPSNITIDKVNKEIEISITADDGDYLRPVTVGDNSVNLTINSDLISREDNRNSVDIIYKNISNNEFNSPNTYNIEPLKFVITDINPTGNINSFGFDEIDITLRGNFDFINTRTSLYSRVDNSLELRRTVGDYIINKNQKSIVDNGDGTFTITYDIIDTTDTAIWQNSEYVINVTNKDYIKLNDGDVPLIKTLPSTNTIDTETLFIRLISCDVPFGTTISKENFSQVILTFETNARRPISSGDITPNNTKIYLDDGTTKTYFTMTGDGLQIGSTQASSPSSLGQFQVLFQLSETPTGTFTFGVDSEVITVNMERGNGDSTGINVISQQTLSGSLTIEEGTIEPVEFGFIHYENVRTSSNISFTSNGSTIGTQDKVFSGINSAVATEFGYHYDYDGGIVRNSNGASIYVIYTKYIDAQDDNETNVVPPHVLENIQLLDKPFIDTDAMMMVIGEESNISEFVFGKPENDSSSVHYDLVLLRFANRVTIDKVNEWVINNETWLHQADATSTLPSST